MAAKKIVKKKKPAPKKKIVTKSANKAVKKAAKKEMVKKSVIKKAIKTAVKKVVIKAVKPAKGGAKKARVIGKVIHYFDNIKVAVLNLTNSLEIGDVIRIAGGEKTDFQQKVQSMEVDHQKIAKAKKGQEVGLKVKERVREGYKVYKT